MASEIASKLHAKLIKGKKGHGLAEVYHRDKRITWFGIRRSSKKDKGHDHVWKNLCCSPHYCKELAYCTKTEEDWINLMKDQGYI